MIAQIKVGQRTQPPANATASHREQAILQAGIPAPLGHMPIAGAFRQENASHGTVFGIAHAAGPT